MVKIRTFIRKKNITLDKKSRAIFIKVIICSLNLSQKVALIFYLKTHISTSLFASFGAVYQEKRKNSAMCIRFERLHD